MQFGPDAATEIIAPAGVPFGPGFDVIGFGSEVTPAMAADGINAGIIFYNSGYSKTNTWPSVKYTFISSFSQTGGGAAVGGIVFGMGIVPNPSVSEAENIVLNNTMVLISNLVTPFNPALAFEQLNYGQTSTVVALSHGTTATGPGTSQNGKVYTFNSAGGTQTNGDLPP